MKSLDLTLPDPAANLALDEALLDACEEGRGDEVLRFWEPQNYFVVVGYSNQAAIEVNLPACQAKGMGVFRRCSGGGTVLQGPGCLNYSLILNLDRHESLNTITGANCHIMNRQRDALSALLGKPIKIEGHTDLAFNGLKFSGNAQRRKRRTLLFHGTFLLQLDLSLMENFLPMPGREPAYRLGRAHKHFLTNLQVQAEAVKSALRNAWEAKDSLTEIPGYRLLLEEKYGRTDWNLKF